MQVWFFLIDSNREEKSAELERDDFHSRYTGNAERQLPVFGSQFSVGLTQSKDQPRIFTDFDG
jgi:hypothetical protein